MKKLLFLLLAAVTGCTTSTIPPPTPHKQVTYVIENAHKLYTNGYYRNGSGERVDIDRETFYMSHDFSVTVSIPVGQMAEIDINGEGYKISNGFGSYNATLRVAIMEGATVMQEKVTADPYHRHLAMSYTVR